MSMPKKTVASLNAYNLSCTSTTESSSEKFTAPPDTRSLVNHEPEATEFDAAVFISECPQTETASPLPCLKPTEIQEHVNIVGATSQKPDKQTPRASLITLVGPHEHAVVESLFCSDGPVDAIEKILLSAFQFAARVYS